MGIVEGPFGMVVGIGVAMIVDSAVDELSIEMLDGTMVVDEGVGELLLEGNNDGLEVVTEELDSVADRLEELLAPGETVENTLEELFTKEPVGGKKEDELGEMLRAVEETWVDVTGDEDDEVPTVVFCSAVEEICVDVVDDREDNEVSTAEVTTVVFRKTRELLGELKMLDVELAEDSGLVDVVFPLAEVVEASTTEILDVEVSDPFRADCVNAMLGVYNVEELTNELEEELLVIWGAEVGESDGALVVFNAVEFVNEVDGTIVELKTAYCYSMQLSWRYWQSSYHSRMVTKLTRRL